MTTVVNNPGGVDGDSSGAGLVLGVILGIILIALFFVYGWPALRNNQVAPTPAPQTGNGGIDVNVTLPPAPSPARNPTPATP